jgi:hypothetical protein
MLVMVVGAGLLLRSFHRLQRVNAGFSSERVLSFRLDLPEQKYENEEQQIGFYQRCWRDFALYPACKLRVSRRGCRLGAMTGRHRFSSKVSLNRLHMSAHRWKSI